MLSRYLLMLSVLVLSSCTTTDVVVPDTDTGVETGGIGQVDTGNWMGTGMISHTGTDIIGTGTINATGTMSSESPLVENLSGSGNEYNPIFVGLETKVIPVKHTQGIPTRVAFKNSEAKSMRVLITFPQSESGANLRLAQIVMPDGQMDGPYGTDTTIELTQLGGYFLRFNESTMAGDPWSGDAIINITLLGK